MSKVKNDFVKHRWMFDARAESAKISEIRGINTIFLSICVTITRSYVSTG